METKNIKQSVILDCPPEKAYKAWMDSETHGEMINGSAKIENKVGGKFIIWDGAVTGKTLELNPTKHRIVQSWRYEYDDWPKDQPSKITIEFRSYSKTQTKINFEQSHVPSKYVDEIADGWKLYYWEPMKEFFLK